MRFLTLLPWGLDLPHYLVTELRYSERGVWENVVYVPMWLYLLSLPFCQPNRNSLKETSMTQTPTSSVKHIKNLDDRPCDLCLIPNTPCSMVWDRLFPSCFKFLHAVIEEKVYKDGVDMSVRVLTQNFASNQLDAPDAACYLDSADSTRKTDGTIYLVFAVPTGTRSLSSSCP
jgi:hypothetical protein